MSGIIMQIFYGLVLLVALYLCFKCNEEFSILGFLAAFCCSPFYVIYKLATGDCFK